MLSTSRVSCSLGTKVSKPDSGCSTGTHNSSVGVMTDAERNIGLEGSDEEPDDAANEGKGSGRSKSRRELPAGAVATLKAWLLSPEHFTHPYPTPQDQAMLMQKTGIDKKQLKNWFTNARRRIWKPMLKKQIEQGKLTSTGAGGAVAVPGVVPGLMVPTLPGAGGTAAGGNMDNPHSIQAVQRHYQQAVQHQGQQQQVSIDAFGQQVFVQQPQPQQPQPQPQPQQQPQPQPQAQPQAQSQAISQPRPQSLHEQQTSHPGGSLAAAPSPQYYVDTSGPSPAPPVAPITSSTSIGSLPPMTGSTSGSSGQPLSKTDSHAVLMELFARDQDLVRQATESARMKAAAKSQNQNDSQPQQQGTHQQGQQVSSQHPMKIPSQGRVASVPSLNSWPHFSSISSLNNLGTMPGVKSITSLSGADLASQGTVNKKGNLAQLKSMESMDQKGKRDRDEDNDVGLSLEDESPSTNNAAKQELSASENSPMQAGSLPAPLASMGKDNNDKGTLKRAYDDALAARGLISVSRSSEKLTDLALPAKVQRTLSQEFVRQQQGQPLQSQPAMFSPYTYNAASSPSPAPAAPAAASSSPQSEQSGWNQSGGQQYPGQHPGQNPGQLPSDQMQQQQFPSRDQKNSASFFSDPSESNASVEVSSSSKCALCQQTNVDTQLRPCGHMFHERCLKPSLQTPVGPPKCPVDHILIQSALLAVPTDEPNQVQQKSWSSPGPSTQMPLVSRESSS